MPQSPLQTVKQRFNDKAGLVSAVKALMSDELWNGRRLNTEKGLASVANRKLLRLHDMLSRVKQEFGSRAKLIDAIAEAQNRSKDADYKRGLERHPLPRLVDLHAAAQRRRKRAAS